MRARTTRTTVGFTPYRYHTHLHDRPLDLLRPAPGIWGRVNRNQWKISNFELIWRVSPTIARQSNKISCKSDHFLSLPSSSLHDSLSFLDKNNQHTSIY